MKKLTLPTGHNKLLLHVCCAPCSCAIIEALQQAHIDITLFFYNPNIHPKEEYEKRKNEFLRLAHKHNIPFIDADYNTKVWFEKTKGLEQEPERGKRCTECFNLRLTHTAKCAHIHGFSLIATSLGISRWKDLKQVNCAGKHAVADYPDVAFWDYNWRKDGRMPRMQEIIQTEDLYRQNYCGCLYSLQVQKQRHSKT
jgi:epoxyqueuosine reductase